MAKDITKDDPVFLYILIDKLQPYIQAARQWWADKEGHSFQTTSTFPIKWGPPGFYEKCTRSPRQSPVYGIQAFPIVHVSHLQLPRMPLGAMSMVEKLTKDGIEIEEFVIIGKSGLQSTSRLSLFLCIIPKKELEARSMSRWVYMRPNEMIELVSGAVPKSLVERLLPFAVEYKGDIGMETIGINSKRVE